MTDSIVTVAHIISKARRDHAEGKPIEDHGFNWHAVCLPAYLAERERLAQASPASHAAPAGRGRVEHRQGIGS